MPFASVSGWGMAVPDHTVTSQSLGDAAGIEEAWILQRTGIAERRVAGSGETTSTLAIAAGRRALERAGMRPGRLDLIVVATCTPDRIVPACAPLVQAALGALSAGAFDVNAACAGFLSGLASASGLIRCGAMSRALVIGAEVMTRFVDWRDPKTSVLFGDGAGAVVLERTETPGGLLSVELGAEGSGASLIEIPAGGCARPASEETVRGGEHTIRMNGTEVYRAAVRTMSSAAQRAMTAALLDPDAIDLLICHQANQRIIGEVGARLGIAPERVFSNVERYGNTSAASIPIALCEAAEEGRIDAGSRVLLSAVGAGLTWGAGVVLWTGAHGVEAAGSRERLEARV